MAYSKVSSSQKAYILYAMNSEELQALFSANLKRARNMANLSQMKLAEKADLSVGYICDLESGRRWGTPETFSRLASALGINPFELLLPRNFDAASSYELSKQREFLSRLNEALKLNVSSAVNKAISDTFKKEKVE